MESQGVLLTSVSLGKAHPAQSKGEDADRNRNGVIATEEKKINSLFTILEVYRTAMASESEEQRSNKKGRSTG